MDILIVDGYNMIGAWPELQKLKDQDLAMARDRLIDILADYKGYTGIHVIVVFDAYIAKGKETRYKNYNIDVIFTSENETADEKIEKLASELVSRTTRVFVATSDSTEQWTVFGQGALRKSARELYTEIQEIEKQIAADIQEIEIKKPAAKIQLPKEIVDFFEKLRRGG